MLLIAETRKVHALIMPIRSAKYEDFFIHIPPRLVIIVMMLLMMKLVVIPMTTHELFLSLLTMEWRVWIHQVFIGGGNLNKLKFMIRGMCNVQVVLDGK